ncbi:hypothetical protein PCASD_01351 [Puccinia coronata f. sp. avenae]|uniref:DNA 3'-5' helicase n=1 Tax=Puccinia coronata f. sp. avenae TaxID=200324 RepID=A0A2N5VJ41_9BASI|nr:hypothetical protein PCASD_01351 [Puccinia coronata f. sp. avenae]
MDRDKLRECIKAGAKKKYGGQRPKSLQVDAVMSLVELRHTFVMAGTGFGKSRIAEMYLSLFTAKDGIILVLNPLDALGDNQVAVKIAQGFTAVNLSKMTFNQSLSNRISAGFYKFVYLSPETFVDNELFGLLYYSQEFQARLITIVIDEAHIIYSWGLVASGEAKTSSAHLRTHDVAVFRPSYGDMGSQLMANEGVPMLFLSATCRPVTMDAIFESLNLEPDNVNIIRGELTRPEIRILRFPMNSSLKKVDDLLQMFGPKDKIPDNDLLPTLIYSGSRNATGQVLKVVNEARGSCGGENNPHSTLIRRYHAVTGKLDKVNIIGGFEGAEFPCISCTMALGLGQNWSRVRRVITIGRADPSNICQMIGRCGRDGKLGLVILFMEKKRKGGKNKAEDFSSSDKRTDDLRMDALAITPVCLRICFSIDNLLGYIPRSPEDANVSRERLREESKGFLACKCSNCQPKEAELLRKHISRMTSENFDSMCENASDLEDIDDVVPKKKGNTRGNNNIELIPILSNLSERLIANFAHFFRSQFSESSSFVPSDLFDQEDADAISKSLDKIQDSSSLNKCIGGEKLSGQSEMLYGSVKNFLEGDDYQNHLAKLATYNQHIEREMQRLLREKQEAVDRKAQSEKDKRNEAEERRRIAANKKRAIDLDKVNKVKQKELDKVEKEKKKHQRKRKPM